jgi:hypothetical protein
MQRFTLVSRPGFAPSPVSALLALPLAAAPPAVPAAAALSVPADSDRNRKVCIGAAGAGCSAVVAMPRAHKK